MKYTFAWRYSDNREWEQSKARYDTLKQAADRMAYFAEVNFENDMIVACKLVSIKES